MFLSLLQCVTVWKNGRVDNFYPPCLRRFITLHYDPLAQQTSCLKCLSGFTTQVWIPWFDGYIMCLQEICGLLFSFSFTLFHFQLCSHTWGRLSSRINVYLLQSSVQRRRSDCSRFACFEVSHVQNRGGKNRFQCFVQSRWFGEVMKTHCFYFTDHCCWLLYLCSV